MRRYRVLARSESDWRWFEDQDRSPPPITIYEIDRGPRRTGLYDAAGNDIYAVEHVDPIGFVRLGREGE